MSSGPRVKKPEKWAKNR